MHPKTSILQTIGSTPLLKLNHIVPPNSADVYVKLEYFNPTGSYKDRMALAYALNFFHLRPTPVRVTLWRQLPADLLGE